MKSKIVGGMVIADSRMLFRDKGTTLPEKPTTRERPQRSKQRRHISASSALRDYRKQASSHYVYSASGTWQETKHKYEENLG
jgi:hypothetical protein